MTEWTVGLMVPGGEADDVHDMAGRPAPEWVTPAMPDGSGYPDLLGWAPVEDIQLDVVEWFP